MPKLITRKEAQELFGLSRQALHNRIARKTLKTVMAPVETNREMIIIEDDLYQELVKRKRA